ncbi:MAG: hypothetical protein COW88_03250 [Candidatus Lloydbacteria bacterium CG22_combo_CG10-13_8_21_14_all_47_15]|uniref:Uncharacterized protein n=1 Tax=Candidatus Lloydbacteria bacterium CG22_combo_CG10-13_8_21_14_all_47_15 TaxID=1974635 RepID=A0A2H0CUH0_9BACT|nr:MAG: hypothetical protein COW88_03250 [Candidatus Lloydbacteria bacterium CG22_combo_CG10-13_8_21_14_all_47_15]
MHSLPPIQNLLFIVAFLNLLFFGSAGLLGYRIQNNVKQASRALSELDLENVREENSKVVKVLLEETKEDRARIDGYFIDSTSIIATIEEIETLARRLNVKLTLRSVNTSRDNSDGLETLRIDAKAEGAFENVYRFLSLVERLPHKIFFERAGFATRAAAAQWEANVTIVITSFKKGVSG